jgi:hypothetical protein
MFEGTDLSNAKFLLWSHTWYSFLKYTHEYLGVLLFNLSVSVAEGRKQFACTIHLTYRSLLQWLYFTNTEINS